MSSVIGKSMLGTSMLGAANEAAVAKRKAQEWESIKAAKRIAQLDKIDGQFKREQEAERVRDREARQQRAAERLERQVQDKVEKREAAQARDKEHGRQERVVHQRGEIER